MAIADWRVWFRGKPTCSCVAQWFPVYEAMLKRRGILSGFHGDQLRIFQLTGGAAASAGTHSQGGAIDTAMLDPRGIRLAREMGASASWIRWWPGNLHAHLVLDGCPHNGPARYQITAVKQGYDGTGYVGRGALDKEWRPVRWRTWQEGLTWAAQQLGTAGATNTPATSGEWDEMASKEEVKAAFKEAIIEIEARKTPVDRQAGNAFWNLIKQAVKGMFVDLAGRRTPEDRNAGTAFRTEVANGIRYDRQLRNQGK